MHTEDIIYYMIGRVRKLISMGNPKCAVCGKEMKNAIDSITKEVSPYLWETTCEHNKNMRLARG